MEWVIPLRLLRLLEHLAVLTNKSRVKKTRIAGVKLGDAKRVIRSDFKLLRVGNNVFCDPEEFDDPKVSDSLKVISSECVDFDDSKEFDDPKVFDDPKGISIGSMDVDNPKVYGVIPIFDGLVLQKKERLFWDLYGFYIFTHHKQV